MSSPFDDMMGHDGNRRMAEYLQAVTPDMEGKRREREDRASKSNTTTDELWVRSQYVALQVFECRVVGGLPAGIEPFTVRASSRAACIFDARWELVGYLRRAKLCATQEEARTRAARSVWVDDQTLTKYSAEYPDGQAAVSL